jgi:hypothetical protein
MANGTYCCKYYNRKANTSLSPVCDGSSVQFSDPVACCVHDDAVACTDTSFKCKNYPLSNSKS